MIKILVTGAVGFIGFHLAKRLLKEDYVVVGLDNINDYYDQSLKYARLKDLESYKNFDFVKQNLEDKEDLKTLFAEQKFDIVYNLAAQAGVRYSIENPYAYIESNIVGFINILECCRHNKIKHLIYASSSSVYGNNEKVPFKESDKVDYPISLYAATKKSNELMAYTYSHLYHIPTTGLRFFTVYGPWGRPDMSPMLFAKAIYEGKTIKVFNKGNLKRDFTYIDDIVEGLFRLLNYIPNENNSQPYYNLFNIGHSSPINLMDFIKTMEKCIGKKAILEMYPMQQEDVYITFADTSKLENAVGYKPTTDLESGINEFLIWYKQYFYGEYQKNFHKATEQ
jgi:UDP-glucuronate 4-epimerase